MGRPSAGPQDLQRLIQEADCFAPVGSTVASIVELPAELLKPAGELQRELDPGQVHTPGIFVRRILSGVAYEKPIEQRTVRKRSA